MDRKERKLRFAEIMVKYPRITAGLSRNALALELYVSPKTIQNWEEAISAPDAEQISELHRICGVNLEANYKRFKYPNMENLNIKNITESKARARLKYIVENELTEIEAKQILYILDGSHGGSRYGVIQKSVADLQTPMHSRQLTASIIINNYKNAEALGSIRCPDDVQPDMEALEYATDAGTKALHEGKEGYT